MFTCSGYGTLAAVERSWKPEEPEEEVEGEGGTVGAKAHGAHARNVSASFAFGESCTMELKSLCKLLCTGESC